jgi:hypothetical protein
MKEITIPVLWAATEYYLGALLWIGLAAVALALVLWVVAMRRAGIVPGALRKALRPTLFLAAIAAAAVTISIPALTRSNWSYVAGFTDYVLLIGAGAAAAAAVAYFLTPVLMLMQSTRS